MFKAILHNFQYMCYRALFFFHSSMVRSDIKKNGIECVIAKANESTITETYRIFTICCLVAYARKKKKFSGKIYELAGSLNDVCMEKNIVKIAVAHQILAIYEAGLLRLAGELLLKIGTDFQLPSKLQKKQPTIMAWYKLFIDGITIPEKRRSFDPRIRKNVMYVVAASLPYQITGYTIRTQGIIKALIAYGWNIYCATKSISRKAAASNKHMVEECAVDGVTYYGFSLIGINRDFIGHIYAKSAALEERAKSENVSLIHAASDYRNALPALIAARNLGLPFIYEARGLWEYSKAARIDDWELTDKFLLDCRMEALIVRESDWTFTLTSALTVELEKRGGDPKRISIIPNAVDINNYKPLGYSTTLAQRLGLKSDNFNIGYIGSVVAYEGLDVLVESFLRLRKSYVHCKLIIVGAGHSLDGLKKLVDKYNLQEDVVFVGKVSSKDVGQYYSLMNVMVLPRKPFKVCQLVSPLKPMEIMAMEVPLVVSDVDALSEITLDGQLAFVHKAGNPESLADVIAYVIENPLQAKQMAAAAKKYISDHYTWQKTVGEMVRIYEKLLVDSK